MLMELAIGDAYGAGFEYSPDEFVAKYNDLSAYRKHPRHGIRPGCYTDDTQMSLAIAELMVSGDGWSERGLAERFVQVFKRDKREGYAGGFYDFLCSVKNGQEFLARILPDSDKSGAAMRAPIIGIYPMVVEVVQKTTMQAKLTHNTRDGIHAAVAAALLVHYFVYELGPREKAGEFLDKNVASRKWSEPWRGKVGPKGWMSVHAAVSVVVRNESLSGMLREAISFTGDVDTVAAIALAAGSCSREVKQDLPDKLFVTLERSTYGYEHIKMLDEKLKGMVKKGSR